MSNVHAKPVAGTRTQPQRFVVYCKTIDEAIASGRWIDTTHPVEVEQ